MIYRLLDWVAYFIIIVFVLLIVVFFFFGILFYKTPIAILPLSFGVMVVWAGVRISSDD